ncbi:(R)-mandelonitrile lyase [Streptomyces botrytidirepellens]|uniref:Cupin domain-containing protein n=1 Tax=Streptomyces botrytidirepellens TaxID=2486417 RepID=A0A3M8X4E9_9ACTN|nr:cupin domain-containing protein [Streptomyces botrytidirepellens]RNG37288.1 cupin domain-containing protein [Streptomyces botrytidirepellens]
MEHITETRTVKAPAERFTGDVYLNPIEAPSDPARLASALVRFTPGARTNWHSHAKGQVLYITDGVGLVGTRDGHVVRVSAGETVKCPAGEEHWHGATDTTLLAHIAMVVGDEGGDGTTWLEPVTDEQYTASLASVGR